ncbi:alpha-1,3-mannosyl-glycoprotein 4-beta-N-acetylglucosaminyltransferase B-like [Wyeomyia smithii]|uniref:alpha-1,3-mannosyl-glycoprotein 4-beta-N-acetylglucosaminyltransferase B-like n=1 Tax=Wyeomyia smithii TaxID=174621 RepID=UPI002467BAF4|nr:alpha-1,3-mannosyl-glycoprotein 4-beta-N-acetylglucosaminyltransferase B-like [Wyeomyia smithii]
MKLTLNSTSLRRRSRFTVSILIVVFYTILFLIIRKYFSAEQTMAQREAELQMRIQNVESIYQAKPEDLKNLPPNLGVPSQNGHMTNILDGLSANSRSLIQNVSTSSAQLPVDLKFPTVYHFLPHLLDDPTSFRPAYLQSKNRQGVSIVLGIPTVRRDKQSYLLETLDNLIGNMDDQEQNETMIVIFIGESDIEYVTQVATGICAKFSTFVDSGFIEIIAPAASYYPDMTRLRQTLDDSVDRVRWRSKQNLDFAYLMAYTQPKGSFYVQLEDDIITRKGFISIMKNFASNKSAEEEHSQWCVLDFCQLGFIGKMFKSGELPWLITYFQMFFNEQPVDWLLYHWIDTKVCNIGKDPKICKQDISKVWIHYEPSLFQHIGTISSLKGKEQRLKDEKFGEIFDFYPHNNPPAVVETGIQHHEFYTIQRAYKGESFFWGLRPQQEDLVEFDFINPIELQRYLFRSGSFEQPFDRFYNTTVEMLPHNLAEDSSVWSNYETTTDGFLIVGAFNEFGIAEGVVDAKIGKLKKLRLHVHSDSENWVILREILLQYDSL